MTAWKKVKLLITICIYHGQVFICEGSVEMMSKVGMGYSLTRLYRVASPLVSGGKCDRNYLNHVHIVTSQDRQSPLETGKRVITAVEENV